MNRWQEVMVLVLRIRVDDLASVDVCVHMRELMCTCVGLGWVFVAG
jgi:hypothetical protein